MGQRIFGLETEYALSAMGAGGARVSQDHAVSALLRMARKSLPHLPDKNSPGIFLQNGSRFYIDSGKHPELATCEVVNPWDACRYALAGDQILTELSGLLACEDPAIDRVILTRCNVCYGHRHSSTWACHESYGHRADPASLPSELIPHLVSRIVYTGAGGFDNRSAGCQFMVSPRVSHLMRVISGNSTYNRGIFHEKNESLSQPGYHRLHVLCGDSVCSQTALWLKMAVTSLVVAMIEAGFHPCGDIRLRDPLGAMRRFAADFRLTARARTTDGRLLTALEMQRHLLGQIQEHQDHPVMPSWTGEACRRLRCVLDALEGGPGRVAKTLDWAIKLSLYSDLSRRRGVSWESLSTWNCVLGLLAKTLQAKSGDDPPPPVTTAVLRANSPVAKDVARLAPLLQAAGLGWDQLEEALDLCHTLFELDTRFAQIGRCGLFNAMEASGTLDHQVPGVDNIEHAVANPPAEGRARLRGECVRQFHGRAKAYSCDWGGVWDKGNRRWLDLSDPFISKRVWKPTPLPDSSPESQVPGIVHRYVDRVWGLYDRGRYEDAHRQLLEIERLEPLFDMEIRMSCLRVQSRVQSRRGFLEGPATLDQLIECYGRPLWLVVDYIAALRYQGLVPSPEIAGWIDEGRTLVERLADQEEPGRVAAFHEHRGYFLLTEGRLDEALASLNEARHIAEQVRSNSKTMNRTLATLGEVYRRLGRPEEALRMVERAVSDQTEHQFKGDLADHSLPIFAKLQPDREQAKRILGQAKSIQTELHNGMGEARTLLLEARLSNDAAQTASIKERLLQLKQERPALAECRLVAKVLRRWKRWTSGELTPDDSGDVFWGV